MRIPINLASEPFRRDRPLIVAGVAGAVILLITLGGLLLAIGTGRGQAGETREAVARLSSQVRQVASEQAKFDAMLRQPANAVVLERSLLLNQLIQRKSISWTRMFTDLASVMPLDVQLVSIRLPQITSQNEVMLDMVIGAKDPQPVIAFLKRLQESALFGDPTGHLFAPPSQNEPLYRYRVTVNYAQKL